MTHQAYRKKLIDVSLPLDAINKASIREKSIRHGHPSTLHLWWSRKPLAACRAILFASLVDDPSERTDKFKTEEAQEQERQRLFDIIERLVQWESSQDCDVLKEALAEIPPPVNKDTDKKSTPSDNKDVDKQSILPIRDPFCGGGSIPLEAQRLGLQARASDLNPVAVLITKALIQIPPKFANYAPVAPKAQQSLAPGDWKGACGLADDIRYYGEWVRDEAERRIGHFYPKVVLPPEYGSKEATVIAWLWVRTVICPNPACGAQMPLASKWWLSTKGRKKAWVEPVVNRSTTPYTVQFVVRTGQGVPPDPPKVGRGAQFSCLCCSSVVTEQYVRAEGLSKRLDTQLMAIVAEGKHGRAYVSPTLEREEDNKKMLPTWIPEQEMPKNPRWFSPPLYGMETYGEIFTPRQLVALNTLSDLVQEARQRVLADARKAHFPEDERPLYKDGTGATAYADAVATYLAIAIDRLADRSSCICSWDAGYVKVRNTFARQAIPMMWDFAEANPFSESTGNFLGAIDWIAEVIKVSPYEQCGEARLGRLGDNEVPPTPRNPDIVYQRDATVTINGVDKAIIVTDPPYYDNIGYADLSDFFYIWLRRSLRHIYPDLFQTTLTPKETELVVNPARFDDSKEKARAFFESHLSDIFKKMYDRQHDDYPLILFYAFKQDETETRTGWESMLESLVQTGFTITGTWPIRTEMMNRSVGQGTNALASSIVLVCRRRPKEAAVASRGQFLRALRNEFPPALKQLQHDNIAPVDLAQACIGPGMAIYSRYSKVMESDGTPLRVRTALQLINRALDELLSEQEGEYDAETRWAITWFEQYELSTGEYGVADTLSKAKNVSIDALKRAEVVESTGGKVRLRRREELSAHWRTTSPRTMTVWEAMQRMIYALHDQDGEKGAADVLRIAGTQGEMARDLAYRLYTMCERKGWSSEGLFYNGLVTSWPEIRRHAQSGQDFTQGSLF